MFKQILFCLTVLLCLFVTTTSEAFHWIAYVAAAICAGSVVLSRWSTSSGDRLSFLCLGSILLFGGYCLWRGQVSEVSDLARQDMMMVLFAMTIYLVVWSVGLVPRVFLWIVGFIAAANFVAILVQNGSNSGFSIYSWLGYDRVGHLDRPSGLFFNANHVGTFLGCSILLTLSQLIFAPVGVPKRLLGAFFVVCCLVGVFLTKSRSASLIIVCGMGAMGCVGLINVFKDSRYRAGLKIGALILTLLSVVGVAMVCWMILRSRGSGAEGVDGLFKGEARGALWESAINQWESSPWIGTGAGSYDYYELRERPNRPRSLAVTRGVYVHNDWLQMLAEYGVVAIALGLLALSVHFFALKRRFAESRRERGGTWYQGRHHAFAIGAGVVVLVVLIQSLVEFHLRIPAVLCCVVVCLGFMGRGSSSPARLGRGGSVFVRIVLGLCCVALVVGGYRFGVSDVAAEIAKQRLQRGNAVAALNMARYARDRNPTSASMNGLVGRCYMDLGNETQIEMVKRSFFKKALAVYVEALDRYPQSIEYLLVVTRLHARLGAVDEGLIVWQRAFEWAPLWNETHLARVDALVYGDRRQQALDACDEWYALNTSGVAQQVQSNLLRDFAKLPPPATP